MESFSSTCRSRYTVMKTMVMYNVGTARVNHVHVCYLLVEPNLSQQLNSFYIEIILCSCFFIINPENRLLKKYTASRISDESDVCSFTLY